MSNSTMMAATCTMDHAELQMQAKRLLEGIATAPSRAARLHVQSLALIAFDHQNENTHGELVKAGAVTVLTRCLQKAFYNDAEWEELDALAQLIGMVLRCSDTRASVAFEEIGAELVCAVFAILFEEAFTHVALSSGCSFRALIVRLASLSASLSKTVRKQEMIRLLREILRDRHVSSVLIRKEALRLLSGCTNHPESKVQVMAQAGLVDDIIAAIQVPELVELAAFPAAVFFCNLSWAARNKAELVGKKDFVKTLLLVWEHGGLDTHKVVMRTIRQLSAITQGKMCLSQHGDGALVNVLASATEESELRTESIETLLCLVGKSTAKKVVQHPGLFDILASAEMLGDNRRLLIAAARSLKSLATHISIRESCYQGLLDALMSIATSDDTNVRFWAAKAFIEQTKMSTNGFYVARMARVMQTVTRLARDSAASVKACATEALLNLANDTANAKRLAMNTEILQAFVENMTEKGTCELSNQAKRNSVQAVLTLASHRSAKKRVAKQIDLVAALSKYGVSRDVDSELANAALHGVIVLAPLM